MAQKNAVAVVGHGTASIPANTSITASFTLTINNLDIFCTDASVSSVPIRKWLWELLDSNGSVLQTKTESDCQFTVSQVGTYRVRLTVTNKQNATSTTSSQDLELSDISVGDVTPPDVPTLSVITETASLITIRVGQYDISSSPNDDLLEVIVELYDDSDVLLATAHLNAPDAASATAADREVDFPSTYAAGDYHAIARATDGVNVSADCSPVTATVGSVSVPAPGAFTLDTPVALSPLSASYSWSASSDVVTYHVYRRVTGGGSYTHIAETTARSYTDTGLSPDTEYDVQISATNSDQGVVQETLSNEESFSTPQQGAYPDNEPAGLSLAVLSFQGEDRYWGESPSAAWHAYSSGWEQTAGGLPRIDHITDASLRYGGALRKNMPAGTSASWAGALDVMTWSSKPGIGSLSEVYFRYLFRAGSNFEWNTGGTKFFYWGVNTIPNLMYVNRLNNGRLGFHCQVASNKFPGVDQAIYQSQIPVSSGVEHVVEIYCIAQSAVGAFDGDVRIWFDGVYVDNWHRLGSIPPGGSGDGELLNRQWIGSGAGYSPRWRDFQGPLFWGGSSGTMAHANTWDVSEFYIRGKA